MLYAPIKASRSTCPSSAFADVVQFLPQTELMLPHFNALVAWDTHKLAKDTFLCSKELEVNMETMDIEVNGHDSCVRILSGYYGTLLKTQGVKSVVNR